MTTKSEKALWSRMAEFGCIACYIDGTHNQWVSIHHIDGRTKPGAHTRVLPLCGPHHQTGGQWAPAIHPYKAQFEEKYGSQEELLQMVMDKI